MGGGGGSLSCLGDKEGDGDDNGHPITPHQSLGAVEKGKERRICPELAIPRSHAADQAAASGDESSGDAPASAGLDLAAPLPFFQALSLLVPPLCPAARRGGRR
uniref:Uncharacterized protein n=1 Tax=Oryza sativa subsp. japonica TaxID=39947 RepID=Q84ZQ5_ORYSJ|nr:hypothetical protein [Oryza sativa Japonica Group]